MKIINRSIAVIDPKVGSGNLSFKHFGSSAVCVFYVEAKKYKTSCYYKPGSPQVVWKKDAGYLARTNYYRTNY